jgi:hypothetical protein
MKSLSIQIASELEWSLICLFLSLIPFSAFVTKRIELLLDILKERQEAYCNDMSSTACIF